jgi:hypothetical protein
MALRVALLVDLDLDLGELQLGLSVRPHPPAQARHARVQPVLIGQTLVGRRRGHPAMSWAAM